MIWIGISNVKRSVHQDVQAVISHTDSRLYLSKSLEDDFRCRLSVSDGAILRSGGLQTQIPEYCSAGMPQCRLLVTHVDSILRPHPFFP